MDHLVEATTPNLTYVGPTQISIVTPPKPETISSQSNIQLRQLMPNMAKLIPKMVIPDMKAIAAANAEYEKSYIFKNYTALGDNLDKYNNLMKSLHVEKERSKVMALNQKNQTQKDYEDARAFVEKGVTPLSNSYRRFLIKKPKGYELRSTTEAPTTTTSKVRPTLGTIITNNSTIDKMSSYEKVQFFENWNTATAERLKETYNTVLFVQAHTRLDFLTILLKSLKHVKGDFLLIVSSDVYNQEAINLVKENGAAQIIFPYSAVHFQNEFPGPDEKDCYETDDLTSAKCRNLNWTDTFGNYRNFALANIKHHWWWKINWLHKNVKFDRVLLLEEDYGVLPDALTTLDQLVEIKHDFVSLGNYVDNLNLSNRLFKAPNSTFTYDHSYFSSSVNNMGLVFSAQFVDNLIEKFKTDFCLYDDYNWDFTLMHISTEVTKPSWLVVSPLLSRIQHLGVKTCGTHITDKKATECNIESIHEQFRRDITKVSTFLFPQKFSETKKPKKPYAKKPFRSGGWGDPRDIKMCLDFTSEKIDLNELRSIT